MAPKRPSAPARDAFVELTAETVTDDMIQLMLRHARTHCDPDMAVMCCKALRSPATITTAVETATRQEARRRCSTQINEGVRSWLRTRDIDDRWYAALVGLGASWRHKPRGPRKRADGAAAHPLCWQCNCPFEPKDERRIIKLRDRGGVSVHLLCVNSINRAELDESALEVLAEAAAYKPRLSEPGPDEPLIGGVDGRFHSIEAAFDAAFEAALEASEGDR